jgi:hypothetical protein
MELEELTIKDLQTFVAVYQRNARLRVHPGMDVRVGSHVPPKGGEQIREMLGTLLDDINGERSDAWNAHINTKVFTLSLMAMAAAGGSSTTGR